MRYKNKNGKYSFNVAIYFSPRDACILLTTES